MLSLTLCVPTFILSIIFFKTTCRWGHFLPVSASRPLWMNSLFLSPSHNMNFLCATLWMAKDFTAWSHEHPSPASFSLEAGKLISYETKAYVCMHILPCDSCSYTHLCKPSQKHQGTKNLKPSNNNNNKTTKSTRKSSALKIRHQCYLVSLKSEYEDIWAAPGSVAVTPLPQGTHSFLFLL